MCKSYIILPCLTAPLRISLNHTILSPGHVHVPSEKNASKPPLFFRATKIPRPFRDSEPLGKAFWAVNGDDGEWRDVTTSWGNSWLSLGEKTCAKKFQSVWGYIHDKSYSIFIYDVSFLEHVAIFQVLV